ncbi:MULTISPECIES: hypothetical protein [unclassified Rhizobium]|jgi:hypothetical protein|uniref:hypothetical protein n=2 Tax=Rhizobium TaxID=379 RepID=UPI001C82B680|nr:MULTISPECIES: hypothetical protein [unclassified Rhizobium]MBX5156985.1 hypothetical protein [Rhizobium sp. NZLR8]MBX5165262.1 hypothetical protein [Rhizobium sp. NZLR4b]MBX5172666.1 hypothetical protein [Rhizobium sp. NZLR1b]MBX5185070.1 hypothetical protein [Rhizobium sp. NZLR5]MBX5197617.1 hypothetical protein [Rhizobium sp. NZLR10]
MMLPVLSQSPLFETAVCAASSMSLLTTVPYRAERLQLSIAVVRPPGSEAAAYQSAARIYVGGRRFESGRVVDFSKEKPQSALERSLLECVYRGIHERKIP